MPADDRIRFERDGRVATITLDAPDDMNRLSPGAVGRLLEIAGELERDDTVQAVIVTGAGPDIFSAGLLDLHRRGALAKNEVLEIIFAGNRAFDALEAVPQIVIAAINGRMVAGGVELALACDIRLAADHATLTMPEARWGGFPGAGAPVRLPTLVGHGRALELICTGREIDAEEMARIGLVEHVHPADTLLAQARALATQIAASGPLAIRGAKQIMRTRAREGFSAARTVSDILRRALEWSADVDEAIAAHRENRAPRFQGR